MYNTFYKLSEKILPGWIYSFMIGKWDKNGLKKYANNTSWIFISHIINLFSSFLIFAVVARYLGPDNLGKLNYSISLISIFSVFASLGIDEILKRDLIKRPEDEYRLVGTAFFTKLFLGIISFVALISFALLTQDDPIFSILLGVIGITFLLNPFGVLNILLDSKVASKYNSYIRIFVAIFIPVIKLVIILFNKGIIYIAMTLVLESAISALVLSFIYKKIYERSILKFKFDYSIFKKLMRDSWPLLLSGISATFYSKIDQVMIQHMIDSAAVGIYSGATKITSLIQIFPGIIVASLYPSLVNARNVDHNKYFDRIKSLVIFSVIFTFLISAFVIIFSTFIVNIILGSQYFDSIVILKIHSISAVGIILVTIIKNYLVTENLGFVFFNITLIGAIFNIVANAILIPIMGIQGAAITTVLSYISIILSLLLYKKVGHDISQIIKAK